MSAGSSRVLEQFVRLPKLAQWTRSVVSVLVLAASVAALGLIVQRQHPEWFRAAPTTSQSVVGVDEESGEIAGNSEMYAEVERDRAIASFLAKRYRVSHDVTQEFVRLAFGASQVVGLDPLLILAVMAVESRFNPIAESVAGAKGLMQIIPKYHAEKLERFGGEKAVFEPHANIAVGTEILGEYIQRTGDVGQGLRIYGGGPAEGENSYPARVLDEKRRLQQVVNQVGRSARQASARQQLTL